MTREDILADKARYRPFLQDLGVLLDFDHGYGIDQLVRPIGDILDRVVFDNVRFIDQWLKLKGYGFTLVGLTLNPLDQEERAAKLGVSREALGRAMAHPAEMGFPQQPDELVVPGYWPTATKAAYIMRQLGGEQ